MKRCASAEGCFELSMLTTDIRFELIHIAFETETRHSMKTQNGAA